MNFYVLTLFPEMITCALNHSIIKRALTENKITLNCLNIRDFSENKHKQVDDYPYGGGAGMVMTPQPVCDACKYALANAGDDKTPVIYMSPQGRPYIQRIAEEFSRLSNLIILCGHYEGIDQRIIDEIVTDEISIGDFILTGGEIAAMTIVDSVTRLIPGVLNKDESFQNESFSDGLLEYPQYTRPSVFRGRAVPDVLLSGHHQEIAAWRRQQSIIRTASKRPDLLIDSYNHQIFDHI